jgi:hypothetical protein
VILKMYGILDKVSGVIDGPSPAINDEVVMREFADLVRTEGTKINQHPEDFTLMCCGTWNDASGELIGLDGGPRKVCTGLDFLNVTNIKEGNNA